MIMGANIGSTITAQIIAFNLSALTPVILAVGFLFRALGRRETVREERCSEFQPGFGYSSSLNKSRISPGK
jgi:phosphate:Na+ symporter